MAGRNRLPPEALTHREVPLAARVPLSHSHPHPHPSVLEDRIIAQHREIQSLLLDNQRLAATHVALKQELSATQQELRHLSAVSHKVKAERDAQVREVFERSLKVEAELRSVDAVRAELIQVRGDIKKLRFDREDLALKLQDVNGEVKRARSELQHKAPAINAEIDGILHELQRGRAAIEYEKKVHCENLEHSQAMQKNMMAMAHEIEKLRAELANAEKRARATAAAAATANPGIVHSRGYGSPEMGYGGTAYVNPYSLHKVQGGADGGSNYESGTVLHSSYDIQPNHLHR